MSVQHHFYILVPFYNAKAYLFQCYESIIRQKYKNFTIVFLDDHSSDNSLDVIPDTHKNVIRIRQEERSYPLKNTFCGLMQLSPGPEDIIATVDGDDFLMHEDVLPMLNIIYNETGCLVSYGQYCYAVTGECGHCYAYTREEYAQLRQRNWRASHLRTFKYKLYQEFLKQDPEVQAYKDAAGQFYTMSADVAIMHPLLEIAGYDRVHFNNKVVYGYRSHPLNEWVINKGLQYQVADAIKTKPPFRFTEL